MKLPLKVYIVEIIDLMFLKSQLKIGILYYIFFAIGMVAEAFTVRQNIILTYTKLYASNALNYLLATMGIIYFLSNLAFFHFLFCLKIESLISSQIGLLCYIFIQTYLTKRSGLSLPYLFSLISFIGNLFIIAYFFDEIFKEIKWLYYREVGASPKLQKSYIIIRLGSLCRFVGYIVYIVFFFVHLIYFTRSFFFDILIYTDLFILPIEYIFYTMRYEKRKYGLLSITLLGVVFFAVIFQKIGLIRIAKANPTKKKPSSLLILQFGFISMTFIFSILEYRNFDVVHNNFYKDKNDLLMDDDSVSHF